MQPTIQETLEFIKRSDVHGSTEYTKGVPYYQHPMAVRDRLLERWPDATYEEQTAALLHDVMEDTEYQRADLSAMGYSDNVLDMVQALSIAKPPHKIGRGENDTVTGQKFIRYYKEQIQKLAKGQKVIGEHEDGSPRLLSENPVAHRGALRIKASDVAENKAMTNQPHLSADKRLWFNRKYAGVEFILSDGLRALETGKALMA